MMRTLLILCALSLPLLTGCKNENATEPLQNSGKVLSFSPDDVSLSIGDQISLQLIARNLSDSIFAISAQISYNDLVLSFSGMTETATGDFFGSDAIQFTQDTLSVLHLSISRIQGQPEVSGSGTICTLRFTGKTSGSSLIELLPDQLEFYNDEGHRIEMPELEKVPAAIHVN
jgi:hypothetical protein